MNTYSQEQIELKMIGCILNGWRGSLPTGCFLDSVWADCADRAMRGETFVDLVRAHSDRSGDIFKAQGEAIGIEGDKLASILRQNAMAREMAYLATIPCATKEAFADRSAKASEIAERYSDRPGWAVDLRSKTWLDCGPMPPPLLTLDGAPALRAGETGLLVGEGGIGKTTLAIQLCMAVATGTAWCGEGGPVARRGRACMLACETSPHALRSIWERLTEHDHADYADCQIVPLCGRDARLMTPDGLRSPLHSQLAAELRYTGPWDLVVIDPLSRVGCLMTETDQVVATATIEAFESLALATGACVVVTHHTNKTDRKDASGRSYAARGATALTDAARFAMVCYELEEKGRYKLKLDKANTTRTWEQVLRRAENGALVVTRTPAKVNGAKGVKPWEK